MNDKCSVNWTENQKASVSLVPGNSSLRRLPTLVQWYNSMLYEVTHLGQGVGGGTEFESKDLQVCQCNIRGYNLQLAKGWGCIEW